MNKTPNPKHTSNKTQPAKASTVPREDGKHGQGLLAKVNERKAELAKTLKAMQAASPIEGDDASRTGEIGKALAAVETLLTGDLTNINEANASDLNEWLQTSAVLSAKKMANPKREVPAPAASTPGSR